MAQYIIGVDVGGTNTDAVLLDLTKTGPEAVVASHKATTGTDVTIGIEDAINVLIQKTAIPLSQVASLMIGTTHFINAVVERDASRIEPVAVLRLASNDFTASTPPFIDFPAALKRIMNGHSAFVSGGIQIDGSLIDKINRDEILAQAKIIKEKALRNVVVVGIYSPSDEDERQEYQVRDILTETLGKGTNIVCSRDIAGTGILARENASILNASIFHFAKRTITGFKRAMKRLNLTCPLYLTSNSGQLLSASEAIRYPVQIFSSGPTNSIRGAAFLSTALDADTSRYVIDIGGTTTEVGCLLPSGYPRLASAFSEIGGVRVNFAMPQVESTGFGGGSIISTLSNGAIKIGPESVGQALTQKALSFSGDTLTATDILVAAGEGGIGHVKPEIDAATILAVKQKMKKMLGDCVDRMKTSPESCHVILVGGGAFLCPSELEGVAKIERPFHAGVANAIGAAVAEIGATVEVIVDTEKKVETLVEVRERAISQAVQKGAKEGAVRVLEEVVAGLPYIDAKCKVSVKVSGPIDYEKVLELDNSDEVYVEEEAHYEVKQHISENVAVEDVVDFEMYKPHVDIERIWHLSETDLLFISIGCYILGCAGGGSSYTKYLEAREVLRSGETMSLISISDLAPDAICPPLSGVGSPAVGVERPGGLLVKHALETMEKHLSIQYGAMLAVEIGGGNGLEPLLWASSKYYNVPCVDGDLMGRAFPSFEKITPYVSAQNINELLPVALSDGNGTNIIMTTAKDTYAVDNVLRAAVVTMGSAAGGVSRPLSGAELKKVGVPNTHSLAWRLGRAVTRAQSTGRVSSVSDDIIREFGGRESASKVFSGKIVAVGQTLYKGHSYGNLVIERLQSYEMEAGEKEDEGPERVEIPFKNENLIIEAHYASGERKILATVPDLIMVLDTLTGESVGVPEYRYGLKVMVLVAAAHPLWTSSQRAIDIVGPRAFGYDLDFKPFGVFKEVKSVIDEFAPVV
ncbi:hypothetical protein BP6252_11438 [Coleophoma cylindrospora]|uniref:Hydantoinase n=1 Tax=Coleophoma cylindrospora TaxID=1849047 RepID=A0A3D8QJM2_9HELO|nr:hypothetical protein BP6252_11438 [Coleophoma cylindrospora]